MVELILVRHAKSDWGDPSLPDHDRPLNTRGRSDAPVMAARLARSLAAGAPGADSGAPVGSDPLAGHPAADQAAPADLAAPADQAAPASDAARPRPARIVTSTAKRARATAAAFRAELGIPVTPDPGLYLAPADALLARAVTGGDRVAILVAHDPGLSELACRLSGGAIERLPTCAVARFSWRTDSWAQAVRTPADAWSLDTPRGQREHAP